MIFFNLKIRKLKVIYKSKIAETKRYPRKLKFFLLIFIFKVQEANKIGTHRY
jgi:hypothetical protein